jgi:hypothetical protein
MAPSPPLPPQSLLPSHGIFRPSPSRISKQLPASVERQFTPSSGMTASPTYADVTCQWSLLSITSVFVPHHTPSRIRFFCFSYPSNERLTVHGLQRPRWKTQQGSERRRLGRYPHGSRAYRVGILQSSRPRLVRRMGLSLPPSPPPLRHDLIESHSSSRHIYLLQTTSWMRASPGVASLAGTT